MLNFLTQEQKRALIGITVGGVIVFGLLFYFWWALWQREMLGNDKKAEDFGKEIRALDLQLESIRQIQSLQDQADELKAKLQLVSKRLPPTPEASGFYSALSEILSNSGVITRGLKAGARASSARYVEIPYTIEGTGQYHEIGSFLNLVEENPDRFMRVKTILIDNSPKAPSHHPLTLTLATFMFVAP